MIINKILKKYGYWVVILIMVTSCSEEKEGCTSACASNYDPLAEADNGSCEGCKNENALNYCPSAVFDDGSCEFACEINSTAEVYFINNSNSNSTYDVIWDGVKIATVTPGDESNTFTVSANIQHTLVFRFTNTSNNACTPSTPVVPQCQTWWFDCTG